MSKGKKKINGSVHHETFTDIEKYDVRPETPSQSGVYRAFFNTTEPPLCPLVNVDGCEEAVAATSWTFEAPTSKDLYDTATGNKQDSTLKTACHVKMILPRLPEGVPEAVERFQSATCSHEHGHAAACDSLARTVAFFIQSLPAHVPPQHAKAMNEAVRAVIDKFYVPQARKADKMFDSYTGHGGKYEAELDDGEAEEAQTEVASQDHRHHHHHLPMGASNAPDSIGEFIEWGSQHGSWMTMR